MAILTGNIIIDVYGFNDGEVQTIQTTERTSLLSCKFDCTTLNKWIVDNVPNYTSHSFRLELTQGTLLNLKKNINETDFDNSNISELIRPTLYLSLLNDIKRPDGYSDKIYNLYITNSDREESLVAELNIDFEFRSIIQEEPSGQILLDIKKPTFIGKANPTVSYDTLLSYDELDKWTKLKFEIEKDQIINIDRIPMEPIDIVLPLPDYAKGKGYGLKTFIGSNFFSKDKQVEIELNQDVDDTIYESRPKIYGINKTTNTIPTTPTPFVPLTTGASKTFTIPAADYLLPLNDDIKFIKFSTSDSLNIFPKEFNFVEYTGKDIDYTIPSPTSADHYLDIKISKTEIQINSTIFSVGETITVEFWILKDYT